MLLDHLGIQQKILRPRGGQYLMRPKAARDIPAESVTKVSLQMLDNNNCNMDNSRYRRD